MSSLTAFSPIAFAVAGGFLVLIFKSLFQWLFENRSRWTGIWYNCIYDDEGKLEKRDIMRLRNFPGTPSVSGKIRGNIPFEQRGHRSWKLMGKLIGHDFIAHFWSIEKGVLSYGAWLVHQEEDYLFRGKYLKWDEKINLPLCAVKLMVIRCDRWREEYHHWPSDNQ